MFRQIDELVWTIEQLSARVNQLDRRLNNIFREGTVAEVDPASGLAVMEAGGLRTAMSPWLQRAGAIRDWTPVSPGERAIFISPSGDPGQGLILPGGFSNAFPQNHAASGEALRSIGGTSFLQTGELHRLTGIVDLGGVGGPQVARVGDMVHVKSGSSAGMWPIVTGSSIVTAV